MAVPSPGPPLPPVAGPTPLGRPRLDHCRSPAAPAAPAGLAARIAPAARTTFLVRACLPAAAVPSLGASLSNPSRTGNCTDRGRRAGTAASPRRGDLHTRAPGLIAGGGLRTVDHNRSD